MIDRSMESPLFTFMDQVHEYTCVHTHTHTHPLHTKKINYNSTEMSIPNILRFVEAILHHKITIIISENSYLHLIRSAFLKANKH